MVEPACQAVWLQGLCFIITVPCSQVTSAYLILFSEGLTTVPGTYNHSQNGVFPSSDCLLGLNRRSERTSLALIYGPAQAKR